MEALAVAVHALDAVCRDHPSSALRFSDHGFATRFVACPVALDEITVHRNPQYPDKIKAPRCCAPVYECTIDGDPVPVLAEAKS